MGKNQAFNIRVTATTTTTITDTTTTTTTLIDVLSGIIPQLVPNLNSIFALVLLMPFFPIDLHLFQ